MKTLLRSVIRYTTGDDPKLFLRNYQHLNASGMGFEVPEHNAIWVKVQDFVRTHNHVPEVTTLRVHFKHGREDEVLDQLRVLEALPARTMGDFQSLLDHRVEERRTRQWAETLKEASVITATGMTVKRGREETTLKGPVDSARFVIEKSHDILAPTVGGALSGEITKDGQAFKDRYEQVEADPLAGVGQFTLLKQMDQTMGGAKRHELWLHAGFTGGMKSTFALNWAYNQAVWFQHSSVYFSLEMPYVQCRNLLYSMHSSHPKFRAIRFSLGLQKDPTADVGIPYENIRDGNLHEWHPNGKAFLFDHVVEDFGGNMTITGEDPNGRPWNAQYGKIHIEVPNPDKDDFTINDLRSQAEILYGAAPYATIFVDHAGLMAPRRFHKSTTENLNMVLRDLKKMAMGFNRGMGIAVVALFQISREGFRGAMKLKEKTGRAGYNLTHLSYANEAERSSDVVTASWMDEDLQKDCRVQFQCLKSRDQKPFEPFVARVEWPCRRILTCMDPLTTPAQADQMGDEVDKQLDQLGEH